MVHRLVRPHRAARAPVPTFMRLYPPPHGPTLLDVSIIHPRSSAYLAQAARAPGSAAASRDRQKYRATLVVSMLVTRSFQPLWRLMAIWASPLWTTSGLSALLQQAAPWVSPVALSLLVHIVSSALRWCAARVLCTAVAPTFWLGPQVDPCWRVLMFPSWISVIGSGSVSVCRLCLCASYSALLLVTWCFVAPVSGFLCVLVDCNCLDGPIDTIPCRQAHAMQITQSHFVHGYHT
jgi:hypothetical protein